MKNFKNLASIGLMTVALVMPSCSKDVSSDDFNALEKRVESLEALQEEINTIKRLIYESQKNFITSIDEIKGEDDVVIGYQINFQNAEPLIIYNSGEATTPDITVDTYEGDLYWKINGNWLEDDLGNKVPAKGKTPTFRVNPDTGVWEYSFNGTLWKEVGGSPTGSGVVIDTSNEDYVIFKMDDDTEISIPWYKPLDIKISINGVENNIFQLDGTAKTVTVDYELSGLNESNTPIIKVFTDNKELDVKVTEAGEPGKGHITISSQNVISEGEVTIIVSDGDQRTIMRTLTLVSSGKGTVISVTTKNFSVPSTGNESLPIDFESDVKIENLEVVVPEDAQPWITAGGVTSRALNPYQCILNVAANETDEERSATITLRDKSQETVVKPVLITINQASSIVTQTVDCTTPGGLQTAMSSMNPTQITSLKVTGSLNSTDLIYLKNLSIYNKLERLDMAGATLPDNSLPKNAFKATTSNATPKFVKVVLPQNLTVIGQEAFRGTKLVSIEIPASVTDVQTLAFLECKELAKVTIKGNPILADRAFGRCDKLVEVRAEAAQVGNLGDGVRPFYKGSDPTAVTLEGLTKIDKLIVSAGATQSYTDAGWTKFFEQIVEE